MKVKLTGDKKGLDAIGEITYMVGGVPIEMEIEREEVEDDIQPDDFINSLARKYFDFELVERKHDDMQWYVYVACISKNDKISLLFGSTYNLDKVFRKLIKDYELVDFKAMYQNNFKNCKALEAYLILDFKMRYDIEILNTTVEKVKFK